MLKVEYRHVYILAFLLPIVMRIILGFWPCDDAFITYRYAHNLATHGQFTFNLGTNVFGCTTLGYGLMLSGLSVLGFSITAASWVLILLGDIASTLMLTHLALSEFEKPEAAIGALLVWLVHPVVALNGSSGMETSIFLAALLGFVLACQKQRMDMALVIVALTVWIRIDGIVIGLVWLWVWLRSSGRRLPLTGLLGAVVILSAYAVFCWLIFGSLFPQSVIAKMETGHARLSGNIQVGISYIAAMGGMIKVWYWYLSAHILLFPGLLVSITRFRKISVVSQILIIAGVLHAFPFVVAGRTYSMLFPWYYVPFLTLTLIPSVQGLDYLYGFLRERAHRSTLMMLFFVLGISAIILLFAAGLSHSGGLLAEALDKWFSLSLRRMSLLLDVIRYSAVLLATLSSFVLVTLAVPRSSRYNRLRQTIVLAMIILLTLLPLVKNRDHLLKKYKRREVSYLNVGAWVSANLGREEWIGAKEIGAVGWSAIDNPVFDEKGLVTPEAIGTTRIQWVKKYRPALILDLSSTKQRLITADPGLTGYKRFLSDHNSVLVREDVVPSWEKAPPDLY